MSLEHLTTEGQKAVRLFREQLEAMPTVRNYRRITPGFNLWKDGTITLFKRYLPNSPHYIRFLNSRFGPSRRPSYSGRGNPSPQALEHYYSAGCDAAEQCIRGAIQDIERFDIETPDEPLRQKASALHIGEVNAPITFNTNLAGDNARQSIRQITNAEISDLSEISNLLRDSLELNRRQLTEAESAIAALAGQLGNPNSERNWRSVLDHASKLATIMNLAVDVTPKLAGHLTWIFALIDQAKRMF